MLRSPTCIAAHLLPSLIRSPHSPPKHLTLHGHSISGPGSPVTTQYGEHLTIICNVQLYHCQRASLLVNHMLSQGHHTPEALYYITSSVPLTKLQKNIGGRLCGLCNVCMCCTIIIYVVALPRLPLVVVVILLLSWYELLLSTHGFGVGSH